MQISDISREGMMAEQKLDYSRIIKIIWSRWYWILVCVLIALCIAWIYLWYTASVYSTAASLKFDTKQSEISDLLNSGSSAGRSNVTQSESFVIESRDVLLNAIGRLDYKVSYFLKGRIRTTDVYPQKPFPIEILNQDSIYFFKGLVDIEPLSTTQFSIHYKEGQQDIEHNYQYGSLIKLPGILFKVRKPEGEPGGHYSFKFNSREDFLERAQTLRTQEAAKSANVMQLSINDKNPKFAIDLLNAIMKEYVDYDVKRRGTSASQTIDFIERQLSFLYNKVQESGGALEKFKRSNKIVDMSSNTQLSISKYTGLESQRQALKLEALAIDQLEEQIQNNRERVSLNFSLEGTIGSLLSGLVSQLNSAILEREQKLAQFKESSTPVQLINRQIADIKEAIINNIKLLRERNQKTLRYINDRLSAAEAELKDIPSAERDFAKLQSEFDINQKVFSFLSEKRLEAQIQKAAIVPSASIVNEAISAWVIAPVPSKVYMNAVLIGLIAGIGFIFLVRMLNPYIYDKETVMSLTNTPIIGVIRKFPGFIDQDNRQALSLQQPKSVFAESVRSVRTNISFLASEKNSKVICVTSEVAGEGKSFVTVNLASTLALIEKKVLIIGADLRRSKLHRTFDISNSQGLSTYLANQAELETILHKTSLDQLDFIPSGPVPPNPAELLHSSRMKELLVTLRERYDYILIDTAPVGLVSDSIPLIRTSDINLFVIRSGSSKFNAASIPDRISREYHLSNVVIVLNAFGDDMLYSTYYQSGYSGGYAQYYYSDYSGYAGSGYYTDEPQKKWWAFWKKS